jgi:cytidylate kinase
MIIVILGRAGSGKTVLAKEVSRMTGFPLIEMSTIVQRVLRSSKEENRGHVNLNKDSQEKKDPDWLWREVKRHMVDYGQGVFRSCVISGIREPYLLHKLLNEPLVESWGKPDILVIGLDANLFNRYSRLCTRDGFMSVQTFRNSDFGTKEKDGFVGDNELGIDITLTRCDEVIDGNKPFEQVVRDVEKILFNRKILIK